MTGLLGRRAIATTTMAVEQVVLRHLEQQIIVLAGNDDAAVMAIEAIVADEREHRDVSEKIVHERSILSQTLVALVSLSTEAVIWLGMKL